MTDFTDTQRLETMFPEKKNIDYSKLIITEEGEYSMTRRADGRRLLDKMTSVIGSTKNKEITDLTGNVGGDTILFALHFGHVDSIELDKENYEALKNNVETFKLNNVTLHQGDSTKLFRWKTDVLYLDPPWGGPNYKEKKSMDLHLGKYRVDEFLELILIQDWRPEYIFLKLPRNYNFSRFDQLLNITKFHKFPIRGFFLVGLEVDVSE